ncbi:ATPase AAA [Catellatospora sp. TT07R-123]|uniref:AfsR/SARP family transcriptional regulator n=1 Tax=Catellatospora sp. TT07R-123 TaxID=2733863 RepID=UPI001B29CD86|nr:AfsR/SARP family transcriptional regulator [Catellatospora sp. TT07R-123]GHJ43468.1 ATPase AAA [Catellatospora sp. TT07R-123]
MVRVNVLGPLQLWVAGRLVDAGTPRQRAVLARLVEAAGEVVPADRLIEDLWQGEPPPKALGSLQVYVSNLRRVLEPDRPARTPAEVLVSAVPGYALRLERADVDVWRFEDLVTAATAHPDPARVEALADEALGLWRGPAYAEAADERWAQPEAARLQELRAIAVEYRADAVLRQGGAARIVPDLDRHVRAYPLREEAVRLLALALYRSGRQADALAALRGARDRLADELGVDPGPALRALETDVLKQAATLEQPALAPQPVPGPRPARPGTPQPERLVGRTAELARLAAAADRVHTDGFRVVWVGGEPGAGKSALAEQFTAESGWPAVWGRCPEIDGAPPGWAWSEVLRSLAQRRPPRDELADRLAPLLDVGGPRPAGPGNQFFLALAVGQYLAEVAAEDRLLIVLDDVHRADQETLQVLRQVAARLSDAPVLLVAAYRSDEVSDQLAATWAALAGPRTETLDLPGLAPGDGIELLRRHSGVAVDDAAARLLAARTGGNPLFLRETARLIAAEGPGAAVDAVPDGVRSVLRRRIARLPAPAQTVLRNAAVLGRDVDVELLMTAEGAEEDTVLDGLEAAVLTGLLTEPAPGRVRFTHALVVDTLYQDTPLLRRTRLHARMLAALEQARPGDVAALARHALAAGPAGARQAVGYATGAARQAVGLYAYQEAADLLASALDLLEAAPDHDPAVRLDLLCQLVSAQANAGAVIAARQTRQRAVAAARLLPGPQPLARALSAYDAPVTWSVRENRVVDQTLVDDLETAVAAAEDVATRCWLLITLVFETEGTDDVRADTVSRQALRLARETGDPRLLCLALNARYYGALAGQHDDEMQLVGEELLAVSTAAGLLGFQALAHHILCLVALSRNDFDAARAHMDRALAHSTTGQLGLILAIVQMLDALQDLITGRFDEAERRYAELTARIARHGGVNTGGLGLIGRFVAKLAAGRARECLPELRALHGPEPSAEVIEGYTRALLDAGLTEEARAVWRPDAPIGSGSHWLPMFLCLRAENAVLLADRDAAASCQEALRPWAGRMAGLSGGAFTTGPVDLALGDLARLLDQPDEAARRYADAAELAERLGGHHWARAARARLAALTRT